MAAYYHLSATLYYSAHSQYAKAVANILVIILNYIASKLIIFRKKQVS